MRAAENAVLQASTRSIRVRLFHIAAVPTDDWLLALMPACWRLTDALRSPCPFEMKRVTANFDNFAPASNRVAAGE